MFLQSDPYERPTNMVALARAEAIWNFQLPVVPPPRPWWKLWSKEESEPELPAIVADLRGTPTR